MLQVQINREIKIFQKCGDEHIRIRFPLASNKKDAGNIIPFYVLER